MQNMQNIRLKIDSPYRQHLFKNSSYLGYSSPLTQWGRKQGTSHPRVPESRHYQFMLPSNDYTSENVSVRVSVTFPIIGTFEYSSLVGNTYFSVRYEVLSPVCQECSNITTRWSQNVIIRQQTLSTKLCQAKFCLEAWCVGDASFKGFFILFFTPMKDHKTKMKYLLTTPCFAAMSDDVSITLAKNEAVFRK